MDLVVGATGLLGTEICRRLRDGGEEVRALVRKTSEALKVERLKSFGCEIMTGDLQDKASLDRACKGIETVISTATTTIRTISTFRRSLRSNSCYAATRSRPANWRGCKAWPFTASPRFAHCNGITAAQ